MVSRSQLPQLSRDATHLELICWTGNYVIKGRIQPFFRSNSLKCQSFLQMAMFRCKQKVASKYSKTLKTHFMVNTEHKSPCFVILPQNGKLQQLRWRGRGCLHHSCLHTLTRVSVCGYSFRTASPPWTLPSAVQGKGLGHASFCAHLPPGTSLPLLILHIKTWG